MSLQSFPLGMGLQRWITHDGLTQAYSHSRQFGHPHSMYLMWAAEYGWVLIGVLGLVVAQAVRYFWIKRSELLLRNNNEQLLILIGVTASVSAALFHAGVSAVFMAPGSMLVGLLVLISFWALVIPNEEAVGVSAESGCSSEPRRSAVVIISLTLIVLWLLWMNQVWTYFEDMRLDEQIYSEEAEGGMF